MTENALKCKYNGGTLPLGHIIDSRQHLQPDTGTAPSVLEIFKRYDEGRTMKEIRDWLDEDGVRNNRNQPIYHTENIDNFYIRPKPQNAECIP